MAAPFNFTPIRNTALGLINSLGRPCQLLRTTEAAPLDATKPWRVGAGSVVAYPFRGPVTGMPFPKLGDPVADQTDVDIIMPGDVTRDIDGNVVAAIEPLGTDRIKVLGLIAGEQDPQYGILGVQRIDPAGSPILFKIRARSWAQIVATPGPGV